MAENRVVPSATVDASGGLTNTVTANAPPPATTKTTTGDAGTARLTALLEQQNKAKRDILARIAKRLAESPDIPQTANETKEIQDIDNEIARTTQLIATAENKPANSQVSAPPTQKHIVSIDSNGQVVRDKDGNIPQNPNWDGKSEGPTQVTIGHQIVNVDKDGKVTWAYTNEDAKKLADAQQKVNETNAATAAAAQATTDFATRARVELEERVAKGETAAEIRAEQAQKATELHNAWVRASGNRQSARAELADYNTNRHNQALIDLDKDKVAQLREKQKAEDETSRRGQDLTKQAQDATVKAQLANQRLASGASYMGNVLSTMSELNKTVQPGSDAVAQMLPGLLNLGEAFFSKLGGLPGDVTTNAAAAAQKTEAADTAKKLEVTGAENLTNLTKGDTRTNPEFYNDETAHRQLGIPMPTESQTKDFEEQVARQRTQLLADQSGVDLADLLGASASTGMTPYDYLRMTGEYNQLASPIFAQTPKLSFQTGGVVPGLPGQPVPIMAHAGETVLPTGQPGMPPPPIPPGPLPPALQSAAGPPVPAAPPPPPLAPMGPPPVGPESVIAQFLAVMTQLLGEAGGMSDLAASAAAGTGNPPPAAANPTLPGSAVPGIPPEAAAAQARMQPIAPDGSPFAKPDDVARIFGRQPAAPQGPRLASAPGGMPGQLPSPMPQGAMR